MDDNIEALVLSGGFMKGIPMLGFLEYIRPMLHKVKIYAGTSIGAVIVYLMSIGYKPAEIFLKYTSYELEQRVLETQTSISEVHITKGMFNLSPLEDLLINLTMDKLGYIPTFRDLYSKFGITLIITGTKIMVDEYQPVYFTKDTYPELSCISAVKISASLPIFFPPVAFEGCSFVDGGILDNFPIKYVEKQLGAGGAGKGVSILGLFVKSYQPVMTDFLSYISSMVSIPIDHQNLSLLKESSPDTLIYEIISDIPTCKLNLSYKEKIAYFSQGYGQAKKRKVKVKVD